MFIDFSVQNFRSIRERQTLSLVATKDKTYQDTHVVETGNSAVPRALRTAGLYGANGSGKTNLLRAFEYFHLLVKQSFAFVPDSGTNLVPFALQENPQSSVAEFEITLLIDAVRYQYGFRLDRQRILEEWLIVYRSQRGPGQTWFERRYDPAAGKDSYQFSEKLTGAKKVWQESTRSNALFLSTAVQFNSEMLRPLYDWIANRPVFLNPGPIDPSYTSQRLSDTKFQGRVLSFLQASDIPVADIRIRPEDGRTYFQHVTSQGEAIFDLLDESLGTQRLFALTGPVLDILEKGLILIVDEIESSLHPLLVRRLLELFHDPATNRSGAQLLFTSHSTLLFDQSLFRRDQIYLVEKDLAQATNLVPLSDFQVRKDLILEKAYLDGRFGAVPVFPAKRS